MTCFQKYSENTYKKVNVRSKALGGTQHRNLVFKKVSKHTDKLCDWALTGCKETAFSLYIHTHMRKPRKTNQQNLEVVSNCTDAGRAGGPPSCCA